MARDMAEHAGVYPAGEGAEPLVRQVDQSSTPESPALRALRHALWIGLAPALWLLFGSRIATFGSDSAHAYWNVWRVGPYTLPPGSPDAFNYSPAFAQLLRPLTLLPRRPIQWS